MFNGQIDFILIDNFQFAAAIEENSLTNVLLSNDDKL